MCAVMVIMGMAGMAWAASPPAVLTPGQAESMRQARDAWQDAHAQWKAKKRVQAVNSMIKASRLFEAVLGRHARWIGEIEGWLADWEGELGNSDKAADHLRQRAGIQEALWGKHHWKAVDARLELAEVQAEASRTSAQREALNKAHALNRQAVTLHREGKASKGLPLARQALALRKEVLGERHPDFANSLANLAHIHEAMGEFGAALPNYRRAVAITRDVLGETHPQHAHCLHALGDLLHRMGDHKAALPLYKQALALRRDALGEKHPMYAQSLNGLAALRHSMGDHEAALPLLRRASALCEEAVGTKHPDYAVSLNNVALLLLEMGDPEAALPLFRQALAVQKAALGEKHPDYATGLSNLAGTLDAMGDHKAALTLYKQAQALRKAILGDRHPDYAAGLHNLAGMLTTIGNYRAALDTYKLALEVRKKALGQKHPETASTMHALGDLLHRMDEHKAALPLIESALTLRRDALGEKHPDYAQSLNGLAALRHSMGNHEAALPLLRQAAALARKALGEKHPRHATSLNNFALLLDDMGDHEAALPLYHRALKLLREGPGKSHPTYAAGLNNLAGLHLSMKNAAAALPPSEEALAITLSQLRDAAALQSDRQQLAATAAMRHRLDVRLSIPDGPKGTPASAHAIAWKGLLLLRQQRRRLFLCLARDEETREAAARLQSTARLLAALRLSGRATSDRLAALEKQQEDAQTAISELSEEFRTRHSRELPSPDALAASLPEGAALVDYLSFTRHALGGGKPRHQRQVVAFIHRRGKPTVRVDLEAGAEAIARAIREWRGRLVSGKPDRPTGERLKELIWTPLEKHLEGTKVVLISPDGILGMVPFVALPGRKEGSYLVEDIALAVIPAPSAIPEMMRPVPEKKRLGSSLLVVGEVDYDSDGPGRADSRGTPPGVPREWASLPGTAVEARAVAEAFAGRFEKGKVTRLSGARATSGAVRESLPRVRYAHLATHGYFAPETVRSAAVRGHQDPFREDMGPVGWDPLLLSGLAFAGANREPKDGEGDGILTALEVSEMDLTRLELAVLSACETGLGEVASGEGILGMQRAFQIAGARTVIASLWKVDDLATQQLMGDFYKIAWNPKSAASRAEALRKAQLAMMFARTLDGKPRGLGKDPEKIEKGKGGRRHPYYWAAFVLSGDWR